MARLHSKKGAFFFKYFFIFSAIVLVSFLIIGLALSIFVLNFLQTQNRDTTSLYAKEIASTMSELVESSTVTRNPEGSALIILNSIDLMADCTGYDVFICKKDGSVAACAELMSNFRFSDKPCEKHKGFILSKAYIEKAKNGGNAEFSTMDNFYNSIHSVSIQPIVIDGDITGFAVVAAPLEVSILRNLENTLRMFLFAAGLALILVTIAVYFMTERIAKPIRNLENATRCYSSGDFTYRVPELRSHDELAGLITKFNSMATSLEQLENSRRSFVANVSHEFKTPMTTIGGFINGILDGTIPPEKQDYYLGIVSSEINRLSRMVTMMLNISKIETGNADLTIEQFDISQKLVTTFLGFEQLISEKNIEIEGFEDLPKVVIHGDSAMIDQVIYNLVDNAVKFTNNNGKIIINVAADKKYAYFSVTNSGSGIPKKDIKRIFERFYKVDQSRSTDVKSTGLGLFLVKSIVDLHSGTITAESEPDNFTRFTVKLPK